MIYVRTYMPVMYVIQTYIICYEFALFPCSVKPFKTSHSFSPSPRQSSLTTPPSNQSSKVVTPSNHPKAGFEITPSHQATNEDSLNIIPEPVFVETQQSNDVQSSIESADFNHFSNGNSFDLPEPDELVAEPIGDLSPWKPVAKESRPRAGAMCHSTEQSACLENSSENQSARLENSSENHEQSARLENSSSEMDTKPSPEVENKFSEELNTSDTTEAQKNPSTNPFDWPENSFDQFLPSPNHVASNRDRYYDDVVTNLPETDVSTSVPGDAHFYTYMAGPSPFPSEAMPTTKPYGHNRSKSDCHPKRAHDTTPPSQRKKYTDPFPTREDGHAHNHTHSLGCVKESEITDTRDISLCNIASYGGSKKSSLASLDERGSPSSSSKQDGGHSSQGYSSGESGKKSKQTSRERYGNSGETTHKDTWENFFSSGEARKRMSHDKGSSEASQRLSNSRGYVSSEGSNRLRTAGSRRVRSHDDIKDPRTLHSDETGRRHANDGSSSEERRSSITLYKDEDPTYIENNLSLFLDIDIFDLDKKEEFQMLFRAPVVQYGHTREMQALVVVSNISIYLFKITAPEK